MRIEFCGPLGVGKSTLAKGISSFLDWELVTEPVEHHPFIQAFYKNPEVFGFENNLYFILDYLHQIKKRGNDNFIFDSSSVLHRSYSALNRREGFESEAFDVLGNLVAEQSSPNLLIHLICDEGIILSRIKNRGREFESAVDIDFISKLNQQIDEQLKSYAKDIPLLTIDAANYDFVNNQKDIEAIGEQVKARLKG